MSKELKTIKSITLKAKGDTVEGLWTVYGVVDSYNDRAHAGLFAGATPATVRFLFNHRFDSIPVAVIEGLWEVSRADLPEKVRSAYHEATGGAVVRRRYIDTDEAQAVKTAVLEGAITDMSYGYDVLKMADGRGPRGEPVRELYHVDLFELSDVAIRGAVPGTMANLAAKAGYRYAGGLGGSRAMSRSLRGLGLQLAKLQLDTLSDGSTRSASADLGAQLDELEAKARRFRRRS